jgi:hypothetical protein
MAHKLTLLIDTPTPFDTLAMWEAHLRWVKDQPDFDMKDEVLADAEKWVARKRKEEKTD